MYDWHGYGGGMMWLFWILIISVLVWFIVFAIRRGGDQPGREKSAIEILRERYARDEIDRGEFEQKRVDLSK